MDAACEVLKEGAPPQTTRELRNLVRLRWRFVAQRTTAKNRIPNLPAPRMPALSRHRHVRQVGPGVARRCPRPFHGSASL